MDHVRRIDTPRGRPPVGPVPRVRRLRREDDPREEERAALDDERAAAPRHRPPEDGRLDVLA